MSVELYFEDGEEQDLTLEEAYAMIDELEEDLSGLGIRMSAMESDVSGMQSEMAENMGLVLEKLELAPRAEQVDYIVAFLFMLVCFELMRLVRNWTKWHRKGKGGD